MDTSVNSELSILQEMFEHLEDVVFSHDSEGRFLYLNPAVSRLFGYPPDELRSLTFQKVIAPEYLEKALERTEKQKKGVPVEQPWELEVLARSGGRVWVQVRTRPVYDGNGNLIKVYGVARDVRGTKELDRRIREHTGRLEQLVEERTRVLRESEERFRELAELLPETIFELDLRGNITFVNNNAGAFFQYKQEEVRRGLSCFDMIAPEYLERARENIDMVLRGMTPVLSEYRAKRKDGSTFPCIIRSAPIVKDGKPAGMRGIIIDISDRVAAEEAVRESEEKYRQLFDHAPAGIYEVDIEAMKFLNVNHVMCEYTGYSKEEFLRLNPMAILSAEDREVFAGRVRRTMAGEKVSETVEYKIKGKNGREFWVMLNTRFTYEGNKAKKATVVVNDITERKHLEEQLRQAQKLEAIGTLAGGIAHDFNNLLTGVQGRVSLMLMGTDPADPRHEHLGAIEVYVKSATNLTKQLLGYARKGRYQIRPTNLNELVKRSAEMFHRTKKEIEIRTRFQNGLWSVLADHGQIEQVLLNLYINAWQAMPDGGCLSLETENVVVEAAAAEPCDVKPGRYVKVSVSDTGVGMDSETMRKLFEPFFTTKGMGRGTGLGLASAYGIVKHHGGFIRVFSEKGKGSTFEINLPASGEAVAAEAAGSGDSSRGEGLVPRGSETILLVDDEEMLLNVGSPILRKLGYTVFEARSGGEALALYEKERDGVDLIILDMIMPGLSGEEAFKKLKEINPSVRILLSSGYGIEEKMSQMLRDRSCAFIQKPFDMRTLACKLRELLDSRENHWTQAPRS